MILKSICLKYKLPSCQPAIKLDFLYTATHRFGFLFSPSAAAPRRPSPDGRWKSRLQSLGLQSAFETVFCAAFCRSGAVSFAKTVAPGRGGAWTKEKAESLRVNAHLKTQQFFGIYIICKYIKKNGTI